MRGALTFDGKLYGIPFRHATSGLHWNQEIFAERKGNEFDIESSGERDGLHVMLNPEMIDVSKDVVVRLDGDEVYRGKPQPRLRTILESLDAKLDKRMFFDRSVDLAEKPE